MSSTLLADPLPSEGRRIPEGVLGMFELLLRHRRAVTDRLLQDDQLIARTFQLLAISLIGLVFHGAVVGVATHALPGGRWGSHPELWLPAAMVMAFLGALVIALPSFYFYTQLAGLDASFRLVTAQAIRTQATTSVYLLGALPFYVAMLIAAHAGWFWNMDGVVRLGLALPFFVGLGGVWSLYESFSYLVGILPISHPRRGDFVRRMVLAWGAFFAVIAPLALLRLVDVGSKLF